MGCVFLWPIVVWIAEHNLIAVRRCPIQIDSLARLKQVPLDERSGCRHATADEEWIVDPQHFVNCGGQIARLLSQRYLYFGVCRKEVYDDADRRCDGGRSPAVQLRRIDTISVSDSSVR
jgi:hypothetical protein